MGEKTAKASKVPRCQYLLLAVVEDVKIQQNQKQNDDRLIEIDPESIQELVLVVV